MGVVSSTCVIDSGLIGADVSNKSSSVGDVDGGQSRVLTTHAQSTPSQRETASVEEPGVLPDRA